MVGYLLENDNRDTDCVMKVEEYVKLYETPYDVVLESGKLVYISALLALSAIHSMSCIIFRIRALQPFAFCRSTFLALFSVILTFNHVSVIFLLQSIRGQCL